jgi:hypothetical protein
MALISKKRATRPAYMPISIVAQIATITSLAAITVVAAEVAPSVDITIAR